MKVWITKYALTKGIIELDDAEICSNVNPTMIRVKRNGYLNYFHKDQWHDSFAAAQIDANKRVSKKLTSINKQLRKFSNLNF